MKYPYIFIAFLCIVWTANSQVGIGTDNPEPSSILEINSTLGGILIPRMEESDRTLISGPVKGLLVYQVNNEEGFWYFNGSIWVRLGASGGEFISETGVVHNTTNRAVDDFVFGSDQLDNKSGAGDNNRMFFDKSKGAFRAGYNDNTDWDTANIGNYSAALGRDNLVTSDYGMAFGYDNVVSGNNAAAIGLRNTSSGITSIAVGRVNTASGDNSFSGGNATRATGINSFAFGETNKSTGQGSVTLGRLNQATQLYSVAIGFTNKVHGENSSAIGSYNTIFGDNVFAAGTDLVAPSINETVLGFRNERYTPINTTSYNGKDRLFSIGNGIVSNGTTLYNNAFTILKNGSVGIGTSTPNEALEIHGDDNFSGDADIDAHSYGNNITSFHIRSAAGTQNNPLAVSNKSNANFYNMEAQGYDGDQYITASAIRMGSMANNLTGDDDMPGRIDFSTVPDGSKSLALQMRIDANGNVGINTRNRPIVEKFVVDGKIQAEKVNFSNLPVFADNAAASSLRVGDLYRTSTGDVKIKI